MILNLLSRLLYLMFLICLCPPTEAVMMKGKIEVVKGQALVYREGRTLQAIDDMNLYTGDILETSESASLLVQMMDVGLLKLKPKTQVLFPKEDENQIQASTLKVLFGEIWVKVRKMNTGETFEISSPNAHSRISNSIVVMAYEIRRRKTSLSVIEGEIEAHKDQNHYFLATGERLILDQRKNSVARVRKFSIFDLNQEWKEVVTIREKLDRKVKESQKSEDGGDVESPIVHIVEPIEGSPQTKRKIRVRATIHESNLDRVILTVNGKTIRDIQTSLKEIAEEIMLDPGQNQIEVKAVDRFGNVSTDKRLIKLSDLPPSISIFFPLDNSDLNTRFVDLQGIVDDPEIREVFVYLNDRQIARNRSTPTFLVPLVLDIGQNNIRVEATNSIGLKGSTEVIVHTDTRSTINVNFNSFLGQ